ncbi:MAG: ExbD/TolR family protein [Lautropia sp.]
MNFRRHIRREDPEINFIPLIDVLLVILIFLMVTTTFTRYSELQVNLPSANADRTPQRPVEIVIAVAADGRYSVDRKPVAFASPAGFAGELRRIAAGRKDPTVVIVADAGASHQSVVSVMEAARLAGLAKVTFAAQSSAAGAR